MPSTLRAECDLNRYPCRFTEYRNILREYVQIYKDKITFTLDIHSFPGSEPKWELYEVVILDNLIKDEFTQYSYSLYTYCKKRKISIALWAGKSNDIQSEMRYMGFRNMLLEFNELLDPERLKEITNVIADWIKEYK